MGTFSLSHDWQNDGYFADPYFFDVNFAVNTLGKFGLVVLVMLIC